MTIGGLPPAPRRARVQIEMNNGVIIEYMVDVKDIQMNYNQAPLTAATFGSTAQWNQSGPTEVDLRLRGLTSSATWKDPEPGPVPVPHFDTAEEAQRWLDAHSKTG